MTAPLLAPGYLLLRDAVSTPRSYLSDAALGLTEAAPRALPQDFAVALASAVLDGGVVVKALLILGLWLAGWGAARLAATVLPDAGCAGQSWRRPSRSGIPMSRNGFCRGTGACWSATAACRGWRRRCCACARVRRAVDRQEVCALVFWTALAGLTPTGLMLAAAVALASAVAPGEGRPRWLCAAVSAGRGGAAALPWLRRGATGGRFAAADAVRGLTAFAARAEPGLGTLGSLASLGGIWNAEAVPASRTTLFAVAAAVVLLAWWRWGCRW